MTKLDSILDSDDHGPVAEENGHNDDAMALRYQAEAEAKDLSQKLKVYQLQFSEYANEKAMIEKDVAAKLDSLTSTLISSSVDQGDPSSVQRLTDMISVLKTELLESASEAMHRAQQIKEETERTGKRSAGEAFQGIVENGAEKKEGEEEKKEGEGEEAKAE